jgi:hypothetical protein
MENEPLEQEEWDDTVPKDTWRNYSATGRLSVVFAGVTFCALFFPFQETPWGLQVATLTAYSVLVFSLAFRDKNCSLDRPQVQQQLAKFVWMHGPFLLLVYVIEAEWLNLASRMPEWLIVRGRKGSFYEWILIAILCLLAWREEHWMRAMVKRSVRAKSE